MRSLNKPMLATVRHALGLACLLAAFGAGAQTSINLNSLFDAVKGVAKSQEVASMSEADEVAIGKEVASQTFGQYKVVRNEPLQRYLNAVGYWVALQSERPSLPWHFAAVQSDQVNAFAVPGGTVLVTTGTLKLVANEAELACVLGHEIGHIVRKHHISLLQKDLLVQSGANALSVVQQGGSSDQAKRFLVGQGTEIFSRSLDRNSERDADSDGVLLAARAGYDPGACLLFMKRMAGLKQGDNALAALYKTHPQAADRAVDVGTALEKLEGVEPGTGARPPLGVSLKR